MLHITLKTATLALVYSTAEYYFIVWLNNWNTSKTEYVQLTYPTMRLISRKLVWLCNTDARHAIEGMLKRRTETRKSRITLDLSNN